MEKPTIVVTGAPAWFDEVAGLLGESYKLAQYAERAPGYVARLADDQAALILADGDGDDWRFWTTTPKTSPATRRIPILLLAANPTTRADGLGAGADVSLDPAEVTAQLPQLARDLARVPDPALVERLACECQEALPPLAQQGVQKFNAGEYYKQHDLFEALWVQTEGPVRDLYRAILQVGVAYYQITRGNHRGALKMLLRSVQWLALLPDECQGVDVGQLRQASYRVRAELERMKPEEIAQFDRSLLQPVRMIGDSQRAEP